MLWALAARRWFAVSRTRCWLRWTSGSAGATRIASDPRSVATSERRVGSGGGTIIVAPQHCSQLHRSDRDADRSAPRRRRRPYGVVAGAQSPSRNSAEVGATMTRIACCQFAPTIADLAANSGARRSADRRGRLRRRRRHRAAGTGDVGLHAGRRRRGQIGRVDARQCGVREMGCGRRRLSGGRRVLRARR